MTENWLSVVGFSDYEVSDAGRVRHRVTLRELTQGLNTPKQDYLRVSLRCNGARATRLVHTLVLEAFRGPRPPGLQSRHLNDIGGDNRLENLMWGTHEENRADAVRNGFMRHRNTTAPLADLNLDAIRADHAAGLSLKQLARRHKTSVALLLDIITHRPVTPYFLRSRVDG